MPRNVTITSADFDLFDQDLTPNDYDFFKKHTGTFKRMLEDQSKKDKLKFVDAFREFSVDHGYSWFSSNKKSKCEINIAYIDESVRYFKEQFVSGKLSSAKGLVNDAVTLAQNRNSLQYMDSNSFAKDPFVHKETREVFRRLFGEPTQEGVLVKVVYVLPLHIKFGGAVCRYLKRWLEAEDKECEAPLKQAELTKSKSTKIDPPPTAKSVLESTKKSQTQEKKSSDTSTYSSKTDSGNYFKKTEMKDRYKEIRKDEKNPSGRENLFSASSSSSNGSGSSNRNSIKTTVTITCPTDRGRKFVKESGIFGFDMSDDDGDDEIEFNSLSAKMEYDGITRRFVKFGKPSDIFKDLTLSMAKDMEDSAADFSPVEKDEKANKKDDSMAIVKKLREESKKSSGGATHVVLSESDAEEWESKIPTQWVDDDALYGSVDASVKIEADGSFTRLREELHLGKPHPNEIYEELQRKKNETKTNQKWSVGRNGEVQEGRSRDGSKADTVKEGYKKSRHPKLHVCSNCHKTESNSRSFKKCARCSGKGTRFYCSRDCQGEDWIARHREEHKIKDGIL